MKNLSMIGALAIGFLAWPAHAQNLMAQVAGTWTLTSGAEQFADGKKVTPWSAGNLIIDPSGHMSFFIFAKDRPTAGPLDPRKPVGPMVAYYGTVTADDAAKTLTYHVEDASAPALKGATRIRYVTITGDTMVTKGSPVKTPQGMIIPIDEWRRAK
jgi:imidazolonepropionase-like amidohydrolase